MAITKHKISNLNKCITEAQQFILALHRQFWLGAVMCRFSSQINNKMGASRETCDLFWILQLAKKYPNNKQYYYNRFWYVIKHQPKLMFEDTFLQIWCKIVGHKKYTPDNDNPKEIACKRCHKWVS